MKYAVILQATIDATEFRTNFGFYNKHIHDLKEAGYEILEIEVDSSMSIMETLSSIPDNSLGFLWLRMHGSPSSMSAAKDFDITLENIPEIFSALPKVMTENATVFLDSCLTGCLKNGFNNIQFAFANLTLDKPQVKIVAPYEASHVIFFSIENKDSFNVEILAKPSSDENIAIILGNETKQIMRHTLQSNISLQSLNDEVNNSLTINKTSPFLNNFKKEYSSFMFGSGFDLTAMLINVIRGPLNSENALKHVRELIESYHASPNYPKNNGAICPRWENATPLSSAIYYKRSDIVTYLLANGADLSYTINGATMLELAKTRDESQYDDDDMDELFIATRRKKENDNSNMQDAIKQKLGPVQHITRNFISNVAGASAPATVSNSNNQLPGQYF